jgi:dimeric dUTPase (all-alpha-NTP-PPase superfamily)
MLTSTDKDHMDFFIVMLKMQKKLQESYGYDFSTMTPQERTAYIKEMTIHINQEMNEMLYELPFFKPWKDYSNMTENEIDEGFNKTRKEFIDFIHFTLNVAIALEMTADEIFSEYYMKNIENYRRQVEGYTHDKSYRA